MICIKDPSVLYEYLQLKKEKGLQIGFAPTMGALHDGHSALIKAARTENDYVVCSIFVNPTQFNDPADFEKYPVTISDDIQLLEKLGTDLLFMPSVDQLYTGGTADLEKYPLGYLETILEGKYRPGHFQGVCQVMSRLLNAVQPHSLFMGQKDYQQCMVVQRLLQILGMNIRFRTVPTHREKDGLAMSSRNLRLNPQERVNARAIHQALLHIKGGLKTGSTQSLIEEAMQILLNHQFKVDYIEMANANNLELRSSWDGREALVALIAAFQGKVRLIDNMILTP